MTAQGAYRRHGLQVEKFCVRQSRHATAEGRLREALASGDAHAAVVQLKHFARSLQSMQLTNPAQARCMPWGRVSVLALWQSLLAASLPQGCMQCLLCWCSGRPVHGCQGPTIASLSHVHIRKCSLSSQHRATQPVLNL